MTEPFLDPRVTVTARSDAAADGHDLDKLNPADRDRYLGRAALRIIRMYGCVVISTVFGQLAAQHAEDTVADRISEADVLAETRVLETLATKAAQASQQPLQVYGTGMATVFGVEVVTDAMRQAGAEVLGEYYDQESWMAAENVYLAMRKARP